MNDLSVITIKNSIKLAWINVNREIHNKKELTLKDNIELTDNYIFLKSLQNLLDLNDDSFTVSIKLTLQERWNIIKSTYLSYTSLPNSKVTKLCCDLAYFLAQRENKKASPLSFLMPSLKYENDIINRVNLNELPLNKILQLYITSDDNSSLIPISLVSFLELETETAIILINASTQIPLSLTEITRLENHSSLVNEVTTAKHNFQHAMLNGTTLYRAMLNLITGLRNGAVRSNNGGTHSSASVEAYLALAEFRKYWNTLDTNLQSKTFASLEFEYLIKNKINNPKWYGDCVDITASEISNILVANDDFFMSIDPSQNRTNTLLNNYRDDFILAKRQLNSDLIKDTYTTNQIIKRDDLNITKAQIKSLLTHVNLKITNDVILLLTGLNSYETELVCTIYKKSIISSIISLKDIETILTSLENNQIKAFSKILGGEIIAKFHTKGYEFACSFNYLSDEIFSNFLEFSTAPLSSNVQFELKHILQTLLPSKLKIFLRHFDFNFCFLIKNGTEFKEIINSISDDLKNIFILKFNKRFLHITHNIQDVLDIVSCLPEEFVTYFLELIEFKLLNVLKTKNDIINFIKVLPESEKYSVYNEYEETLIQGTQSISEFKEIVEILPHSIRGTYADKLIDSHANLTNDLTDVTFVLGLISINHMENYLNSLSEKLKHIIHSLDDVSTILQLLPDNLKSVFLKIIENTLAALTINVTAFKIINKLLPKENKSSYLLKIEKMLEVVTDNSSTFIDIFDNLPSANRPAFLDQMQYKLDIISRNKSDLIDILPRLPRDRKTPYLTHFKADTLARCAYNSPPEIFTEIYAAIPTNNANDFLNEVIFLADNSTEFLSKSMGTSTKARSIVEMIFKTKQYQNDIIDKFCKEIINSDMLRNEALKYFKLDGLNLSNTKFEKLIRTDHIKLNHFISNVIPAITNNSISNVVKLLTFQYNYSNKVLAAMKDPCPDKCIQSTRMLFTNKRVRYQLEKGHGFWGWILQKLGFSKGQRMLKFFDKVDKSFDSDVKQNLILKDITNINRSRNSMLNRQVAVLA